MGFFNKKKQTDDSGNFVSLSGHYLICKGRVGTSPVSHNVQVDISDLAAIFFMIDKSGDKQLVLHDGHQSYPIPLSFAGALEAYAALAKKYTIDGSLLSAYLNTDKAIKVCLWRKKFKPNFMVLHDDYNDLEQGFEIQSPSKAFIAWDLPLSELRKSPSVRFTPEMADVEILTFSYPVRIGSLVLDNLKARLYKARDDAPVLNFYSSCYDANNSFNSFKQLHQLFSVKQNIPVGHHYEHEDQQLAEFKFSNIHAKLLFSFDCDQGIKGGSTCFFINNQRDYETLLSNDDYESQMQISELVVLLNSDASMQCNYKEDSRVKNYPAKLQQQHDSKPIIWRDDKNRKIGFAEGQTALLFDFDSIQSMDILNVAQGRGHAYADLKLNLKHCDYGETIFTGQYHLFDTYAEQIAKITGVDVNYLPEGINA